MTFNFFTFIPKNCFVGSKMEIVFQANVENVPLILSHHLILLQTDQLFCQRVKVDTDENIHFILIRSVSLVRFGSLCSFVC